VAETGREEVRPVGKRSGFPIRELDHYPTPFAAVLPLISHLRADSVRRFVEPCSGDGHLVQHLSQFGIHCVFQGDIRSGFDALDMTREWYERQGADCLLTNPPWSRHVMHALLFSFVAVAPVTWLLLDADWAHTQQAAPHLKLCSKIVAIGRLRWVEGSKHSGLDNSCWYKFERGFRGRTEFVPRLAEAA
jgi:hypothetical protein